MKLTLSSTMMQALAAMWEMQHAVSRDKGWREEKHRRGYGEPMYGSELERLRYLPLRDWGDTKEIQALLEKGLIRRFAKDDPEDAVLFAPAGANGMVLANGIHAYLYLRQTVAPKGISFSMDMTEAYAPEGQVFAASGERTLGLAEIYDDAVVNSGDELFVNRVDVLPYALWDSAFNQAQVECVLDAHSVKL